MGTHPIFESDFDCLTENVRHEVATMIYEHLVCCDRASRRYLRV